MDILSRIKKLNLPIGKYLVYGSGVMEVHGIRKARDVDILVNEYLYKELKELRWKRKWFFKRVFLCKVLVKGDVEAYTNLKWKKYQEKTDDLIKRAEIIEGVPFMKLKDYLVYKKHLPREKDKEDVKLITDYLFSKNISI